MDSIWSADFLLALLCFIAPTTIAAGFVYRRLWKSAKRRHHVERTVSGACARYVSDAPAPQAAAAAEAPASMPAEVSEASEIRAAGSTGTVQLDSVRQPLENLRQRLVEFRMSIHQALNALGKLQESDSRFSMDLGRASDVMHQAFLSAPEVPQHDPTPVA